MTYMEWLNANRTETTAYQSDESYLEGLLVSQPEDPEGSIARARERLVLWLATPPTHWLRLYEEDLAEFLSDLVERYTDTITTVYTGFDSLLSAVERLAAHYPDRFTVTLSLLQRPRASVFVATVACTPHAGGPTITATRIGRDAWAVLARALLTVLDLAWEVR